MSHHDDDHDPLQPHSHEPNPTPPSPDPTIRFFLPNGRSLLLTVEDLRKLPSSSLPNCYIVSTGHGTSGPFTFSGVPLVTVVAHYCSAEWDQVEVVSADGFGNRILASELRQPDSAGPILLAYGLNGRPLSRQQGLVRLIVPSERDDALRQVKWVGEIRLKRP